MQASNNKLSAVNLPSNRRAFVLASMWF